MAGDGWNPGGPADSPDAARAGGQAAPAAPLALYRRYRPASFAEVKGQEHVTEPLRQALRSGRVHHAYLFSGPRGCGKTSSARILARSLNCAEGPTPDPCGKCESCVALAPSGPGSIDVIEIDAASHGGIDDARDLRERAFYSPVAARYKIYIIDEAHMVTGGGFNALLKLVEEPPPHLKFVFATTEPEKVIPTIRSRTHHYPFRLVPPAVLKELLEEILRSEGLLYEPAVLPVVIRAGAGSVRDSLSILDQLIAGSDETGLRYDRAIALLGYTDEALLDEVLGAFAGSDGAGVFAAINRVIEAGHDPRRFAADLLDRLRDLIVLDAVPGAAASGLVEVPEDRLQRMREQAAGMGSARLVAAAETVNAGLVEMRGATSPRLQLELICAQVLLPAARPSPPPTPDPRPARPEAGSAAERSVPVRAETPARPVPGPAPRPPAEAPARPVAAPSVSAPVSRAGAPAAGTLDLATLRARRDDILTAIREIRKVAWLLLNDATFDSLDGTALTIAFQQEGQAKGFAASNCDTDLADVIERLFGSRLMVRTTVSSSAARPIAPIAHPSRSSAKDEAPAPQSDPPPRPKRAASAPRRPEPTSEDPRLSTNDTPGDPSPGDLLSGSDLIQQALGGQMIADTGET